jgi:hypothetical protein
MNSSFQLRPMTLGLFEKRIAGDDSLTELARYDFPRPAWALRCTPARPRNWIDSSSFGRHRMFP